MTASVEQCIMAVAQVFGISVSELLGRERNQCVSHPRQAAMSLARFHAGGTYEAIGLAFGGRDHRTIMHGVSAAEARRERDEDFADMMQRACTILPDMPLKPRKGN
jgi:chromosomal replication initiator protein